MLKRTMLAAVCLAWLVPAAPALAGEQATLTLKSGERISGELWDDSGGGFQVKVNGQDRQIPRDDVAVIEFAAPQGGAAAVRRRAAAGQQMIVMRNGDVVEGRLTDIGGTTPLRITVQTASGERNLSSADVAQIVLAPGDAVRAPSAVGTVGQGGSRTFTVPGNQQWTETDLLVQQGETVAFRVDGQINFTATDRTGAAGMPRGTRGAATPLPSAPAGALIGRIDDGQPFIIGNQSSVRMPATGRLWLGINDDVVDDNGGEFRVIAAPSGARRR